MRISDWSSDVCSSDLGAAAVLLEAPRSGDGGAAVGGLRLGPGGEHTWPNSLDVMGWEVENDGLGVLFSRDIPALTRERMGPVVDGFLPRHGLTRADIDGYRRHTGAAHGMSALEDVLGVPAGAPPTEPGWLPPHA